ncbi:MAG: thiamine pyrophosphate-binding protein, partial [Hyphomicrobiaceae bacterium]|nr:thiamine pyrophosphate-binding protein [Hyphomicrobiaceae bacterium]
AGLFGRYDRIANGLIAEADLILVAGCKLGEIATKRYTLPTKSKPIVHIDIDPAEIGRTLAPEIGLWGDVRETIRDVGTVLVADAARIKERQAGYAAEVGRRMAAWRAGVGERLTSDETPVSMARLLNELNALMPADGILVADGGFAAHWGGLLYDTKRAGRGFVPDRGFASIGYGLPGAMGAALAAPGRAVVSLTGDGGFNMMLGELETARRLALDLTVIVVNNAASGYVKALQHLMYGAGNYHASDLAETDYAKVAQALGCHGGRVEEPAELAAALKSALSTKGPSVVDVVVTRDPAKMLPAVDNRTVEVKKGDRMA